jgi:hypothetical protein
MEAGAAGRSTTRWRGSVLDKTVAVVLPSVTDGLRNQIEML